MIISIISAISKNGVIGNKNTLPWHLPADFKHFKEKTINKTIILGLNTFKSIGEKPLPSRKHIILSNDPIENLQNDCYWAKSIDEALQIKQSLSGDEEVMICGGAMVYKQFLPLADKLYLTLIHQDFEGDTFFPEFNMGDWVEVSREDHEPDDPPSPGASEGQGKNKYAYSFVTLERKKIQKNAYICGPLTELHHGEQLEVKTFYQMIADVCEEVIGIRAFVPHEHFDPLKHAHFTPQEVDKEEREQVCYKTSVLILVAVAPSWGGGIEVEMSNQHGVPVIILCERKKLQEKKISRLLRGNPAVKAIIEYDTYNEAITELKKVLSDVIKKSIQ